MTNFEFWKEHLEPKDLIVPRIFEKTKCVYISCEMNCPAENCPARRCVKQKKPNWERWKKFAVNCSKWWLRWANAEREVPHYYRFTCEKCKGIKWVKKEGPVPWKEVPAPCCDNPNCKGKGKAMRFSLEYVDR